MDRCGKLRNILDSDIIPLKLNLRLYDATVCSLLTYGCETWTLNEKTKKLVNHGNPGKTGRSGVTFYGGPGSGDERKCRGPLYGKS